MEVQEKRSIINLIASILIFSIFSIIFYYSYDNWGLNPDKIFYFWSIYFIGMIICNILVQVLVMIILSIINAAINEIQGNEQDEIDLSEDERDKMIQMKSNLYSMYVFVLGLGVAFLTQLFDLNNHIFFIVLFSFGFLSDITSNILSIKYYKKGM